MTRHPIHPMLVHFPLAAWLFTAASDVAWLVNGRPFFSHMAVFLCLAGVAVGALAAMFGAGDLQRVKGQKALERIAYIHASLMGTAWVLSLVALVLRIDEMFMTRIPEPLAVIVLDFVVAALVLAGAFFGGELVYRHGVGVKRET
jgi:uncharacterized membrane protein